VAVERVSAAGRSVHVLARICASEAGCAGCGVVSRRVHSSYQWRLADTASGGQGMLIDPQVRRFFCGNPACAKTTFAEQVPGLTTRYKRRTCSLQAVLQAVALALGGRPGARLTGRLRCTVSRSTLVQLIRAAADPDDATPLVLGVDDFALRKGHVYDTLLVDIETRWPVDMLPERSAESFRAWLDAHPGVEIICRDRGGCYAEGAAAGTPLAIQPPDPARPVRPAPGLPAAAMGRRDPRHAELRERGYQGSLRTLRRLTAQLRRDTAVPAPPSAPPTKKVASWILTPPGKLTDDHRAALTQITGRGAELTAWNGTPGRGSVLTLWLTTRGGPVSAHAGILISRTSTTGAERNVRFARTAHVGGEVPE
jgi:hypothetical protein